MSLSELEQAARNQRLLDDENRHLKMGLVLGLVVLVLLFTMQARRTASFRTFARECRVQVRSHSLPL